MSYYPPQGSSYGQPVLYSTGSHHGHHDRHHHHQPSYGNEYYGQQMGSEYYGQPGGVVYSQAPAAVVVQPSSHGHRSHRHHDHYHMTFGERLRRFFGLAPRSGYRFKSNHSTWGFLGHSRRTRYVDARTGGEVDKRGRPIYRV